MVTVGTGRARQIHWTRWAASSYSQHDLGISLYFQNPFIIFFTPFGIYPFFFSLVRNKQKSSGLWRLFLFCAMMFFSVLGGFHMHYLSGPYAQEYQGPEEVKDLSAHQVLFTEKCVRYSVSPL